VAITGLRTGTPSSSRRVSVPRPSSATDTEPSSCSMIVQVPWRPDDAASSSA